MRRAGRVVAEMHDRIRAALRPGVTTLELDALGRRCWSGGGPSRTSSATTGIRP